jgi:4-amino-4-deoxy-L-arabinose transferase-like glycosyltransferase
MSAITRRNVARRALGNPDHLGLAVITTIYLLIAIYISPFHEIALEDDWAYAATVKRLLAEHRLQISEWASASLIFSVFWGALFCLPFGFSFSALRISTLVLGFAGVLAFYKLLRELDVGPGASTLGVLCLMLNPIYLYLSFTFMTDIPYLALNLIATLFYLKGLKTGEHRFLWAGSIAAACGFLTRQTGIAILGGVGLYLLANGRKLPDFRKSLAIFLVPILTIIAYFAAQRLSLLNTTWAQSEVSMGWTLRQFQRPGIYILSVYFKTFTTLAYLGLFVLPLLVGVAVSAKKFWQEFKGRKLASILAVAWVLFVLASTLYYAQQGQIMPYLPWFFNRVEAIVPYPLWLALTIVTVAATVFFGLALIKGWPQIAQVEAKERRLTCKPLGLLALIALCHWALLLIFAVFGDEYLLTLLPFAISAILVGEPDFYRPSPSPQPSPYARTCGAGAGQGEGVPPLPARACPELAEGERGRGRGSAWVLSILATTAMLVVSLIFAQGFISRIEAAWAGGHYLRSLGVDYDDMQVTLTWDGWFMFDRLMAEVLAQMKPEDTSNFDWERLLEQRAAYQVVDRAKLQAEKAGSYRLLKVIEACIPILGKEPVYVIQKVREPKP